MASSTWLAPSHTASLTSRRLAHSCHRYPQIHSGKCYPNVWGRRHQIGCALTDMSAKREIMFYYYCSMLLLLNWGISFDLNIHRKMTHNSVTSYCGIVRMTFSHRDWHRPQLSLAVRPPTRSSHRVTDTFVCRFVFFFIFKKRSPQSVKGTQVKQAIPSDDREICCQFWWPPQWGQLLSIIAKCKWCNSIKFKLTEIWS